MKFQISEQYKIPISTNRDYPDKIELKLFCLYLDLPHPPSFIEFSHMRSIILLPIVSKFVQKKNEKNETKAYIINSFQQQNQWFQLNQNDFYSNKNIANDFLNRLVTNIEKKTPIVYDTMSQTLRQSNQRRHMRNERNMEMIHVTNDCGNANVLDHWRVLNTHKKIKASKPNNFNHKTISYICSPFNWIGFHYLCLLLFNLS